MVGNYLKWRQDRDGIMVACMVFWFLVFASSSRIILSRSLQRQFQLYVQKKQEDSSSIHPPWDVMPVNARR